MRLMLLILIPPILLFTLAMILTPLPHPFPEANRSLFWDRLLSLHARALRVGVRLR
jgi:hypothetical protein